MGKSFLIACALSIIIFALNYRKITVRNYRNRKVILFGLPLSLLISVILFLSGDDDLKSVSLFYLLVSLIGFLDDIYGTADKGIKGHLRALLKGRLTTGLIKLIGIAAISFYAAFLAYRNTVQLLASFLLLASFSNLFNLLDLRPGRAVKISIPLFILILLFAVEKKLTLYIVFFAYLIYLYLDLKEITMLGDAGSNSLGFLIGNLIIITVKIMWVQLLLAFSAVLLNLLSERFSFTEIIRNNRILRFIDEIGRVSHEP
jgi:hypothetical protein